MPRTKNAKNKPKSKEKKLYKIGQLADLLSITPRSIRYLDQLGLLPHMKRSAGKTRLFDTTDIQIIKEAYKLKKSLRISFEEVRDMMLKKTTIQPTDIAIISNNTQNIHTLAQKKVALFNLNITFNTEKKPIKEIWKNIKNNQLPIEEPCLDETIDTIITQLKKEKIKHVFIILTKKTHTAWKKSLEKLKKSSFTLYTYISHGSSSSSHVLTEQLLERILHQDALEELTLLLTKQLPMIYQIGFCSDCNALLQHQQTNTEYTLSPFIKQVLNFKPIFIHQNKQTNITDCLQTQEKASEKLIEYLTKELENRGNYCHKLLITHSQNIDTAKKLQKKLQTLTPHLSILIREMCLEESLEMGINSLVVSII